LKIKFGDREAGILALILIALFSFIFFGFTGFKVIIGFILLFFLPFYLILDNFKLEMGEKIIFSFFIGAIMFPALVYLLGRLMSVRISIWVSFVMFVLVGLLMRKFRFKGNKNPNNNQQ